MPDLAELDQKLAALKVEVRNVAQLLERVLGADRSKERLEALLVQLESAPSIQVGDARHAGFWPRTVPPPAASVAVVESAAGVVGAAAVAVAEAVSRPEYEHEPEREPAPEQESELEQDPELEHESEPEPDSGSEPESEGLAASPSHSDTDPDVVPLPVVPPPMDTPAAFAALFDLSEPPPPRISYASPSDARGDTAVSPPPQPTADDDSAARKARMEALLDQDLDPNDFPSQPPRPRSHPPQPIVPQQAAVPAEGAQEVEEDFELLVDDDEILELDEGELEIVDDE